MEDFIDYVSDIRKERGITIEKFAAMIEVSPSTIRNWEKKRRMIGLDKAEEICRVLKITYTLGFSCPK